MVNEIFHRSLKNFLRFNIYKGNNAEKSETNQ